MEYFFEWDANKKRLNLAKHRISFEEAKSVFYDNEAIIIDDPEHSKEEDRFIILGFSDKANLLVVCHCYRAGETVILFLHGKQQKRKQGSIEK